MADQIIIELIADTSQLSPAVELLHKMGQVSAEDAAAFSKLSQESTKSFEKIQSSTKSAAKGITDITKAVDGMADSFIKGFNEGVVETLAEAGVSVEDFQKAIDAAAKSTDDLNDSEENLKKQLKAMKAEAALTKKSLEDMAAAGKTNSKEFKDLSAKYNTIIGDAGRLNDIIGDVSAEIATAGSDTSGLDKTLRLANLGTGAFTAYQGSMEMFGGSSEDAQKTLVKLNSAMAILNGMQAVQEELSRKDSLATKALTIAKSAYTAVVGTSTGALKLFRIALASTGIGLIVLAVAALVTNFDKVKSAVSNLFPSLKGFGDVWDKIKATMSGFFDATFAYFKTLAKVTIDIFTFNWGAIGNDLKKGGEEIATKFKEGYERKMRELDLEKIIKSLTSKIGDLEINIKVNEGKSGKTDYSSRIAKAEAEGKKAATELEKFQNDAGKIIENYTEEQIQKYNEFRNAQVDANNEVLNQQRAINKDTLQDAANLANSRVLLAVNGSKAELDAKYLQAKAEYNLAINEVGISEAKKAEIKAQYIDKIQALNKEANDRQHKNTIAGYEASLIAMEQAGKKADEKYLITKKKSINSEYQYQINEAIATYGKESDIVKKLKEQRDAEIKKAVDESALYRLSVAKSIIQTQLYQVKEGTAEELKLKMDMLDNERQAEIIGAGKDSVKLLEIDAKYTKAKEELLKASNRKILEDALGAKIADNNARLAQLQRGNVAENNAELIRLKQDNIDYQAKLDIDAVKNSVASEAFKAAKIKEIQVKAAADKQAIIDGSNKYEIEQTLQTTNSKLNLERSEIELSLSRNEGSLRQRIEMRKRLKQIEFDAIEAERKANEDDLKKGIITREQYENKKRELDAKTNDLERKNAEETAERKKQILQAGFDIAKQLSDALFEIDAQSRQAATDAELANLEARKEKELGVKNLTEQQKADIDRKYKEQENRIKRKAYEDDKKAKVTQALINGGLAVTNILATMPWTSFGVAQAIAIASAIASTAIQVAKIRSAPVPAFAKGTKNAPAGYALVGEEGPEIVKLAGGEKIYKYADSLKIAEAWRGGSIASADDILTMGGRYQTPSVSTDIISNSYVNSSGRLDIDYDKLGTAVASKMPTPVVNSIAFNKNGFEHYVLEAGSRKTFRNQRYKID